MSTPNITDHAACASPDGATRPLPSGSPTPAAGAQTAGPVIVATAGGESGTPDYVDVTIDDVAHVVDVSIDRDDWELPEIADGHELRLIDAIDDAIETYLAREQGPAILGYFARVA